MADIASITFDARFPKWRMRVALAIAWLADPFVRDRAVGERLGAALLAWVERGVRLYCNGQRVR